MSKFLKPQSGFVYHCITVTPEGDHIRPSVGYGGTFSEERQKKYGFSQEKPPLIFASSFVTKSLAYGLQSRLNEKILCQEIEGSDKEFVITCDRERMLARERDITVYKVPDTNFQILQERERQSISSVAVPFSKTETVLKAKNADDLMRAGLQILSFKETYQELMANGVLDKIDAMRDLKSLYGLISELTKQGIVTWENRERNLNADPVLAKELNLTLKSDHHAKRQVKAKPTLKI